MSNLYEEKIIDHTNKKWFWMLYDTEEEVNEICDYLKENKLTIRAKYNQDSRYIVYIGDVNLCGSGYDFGKESLINYVRYSKIFKEISETKEFKEWFGNYNLFKEVKDFVYHGHFSLNQRDIIVKKQIEEWNRKK